MGLQRLGILGKFKARVGARDEADYPLVSKSRFPRLLIFSAKYRIGLTLFHRVKIHGIEITSEYVNRISLGFYSPKYRIPLSPCIKIRWKHRAKVFLSVTRFQNPRISRFFGRVPGNNLAGPRERVYAVSVSGSRVENVQQLSHFLPVYLPRQISLSSDIVMVVTTAAIIITIT